MRRCLALDIYMIERVSGMTQNRRFDLLEVPKVTNTMRAVKDRVCAVCDTVTGVVAQSASRRSAAAWTMPRIDPASTDASTDASTEASVGRSVAQSRGCSDRDDDDDDDDPARIWSAPERGASSQRSSSESGPTSRSLKVKASICESATKSGRAVSISTTTQPAAFAPTRSVECAVLSYISRKGSSIYPYFQLWDTVLPTNIKRTVWLS